MSSSRSVPVPSPLRDGSVPKLIDGQLLLSDAEDDNLSLMVAGKNLVPSDGSPVEMPPTEAESSPEANEVLSSDVKGVAGKRRKNQMAAAKDKPAKRWQDGSNAAKLKHLRSHPQIADRAHTSEARLDGESRDDFLKRLYGRGSKASA